MAKATLLLLSWLACFVGSSLAIDDGCKFYQNLTPGPNLTKFNIYNPEYPDSYQGQRSCKWTIHSDFRVKLNCSTIQLPWSVNCSSDRLSVQVSPATTHQYCGNGSFNVESEGPAMSVTLTSPARSIGGRFLCEAVAIESSYDSENCRCGWKGVNQGRIVGGTTTGVNEFPMMAGLVDSRFPSVYCGATIIATKYVLSAAHCLIYRNPQQLGVLVGDHDLTTGAALGTETNATVLHRISQVEIHPTYLTNMGQNDIAIVKTVEEIKFGFRVGPACLPFQHSADSFGGSIVTALGWETNKFGDPPSDTLLKVNNSVLTNLVCSKYYGSFRNDQFCTYAEGIDSCEMYGGGPVLWQNPTTERSVLIGIVSHNRGCGDFRNVNTRVGAYMDWITSVTTDTSYCTVE